MLFTVTMGNGTCTGTGRYVRTSTDVGGGGVINP
jgi:hypothetical protein